MPSSEGRKRKEADSDGRDSKEAVAKSSSSSSTKRSRLDDSHRSKSKRGSTTTSSTTTSSSKKKNKEGKVKKERSVHEEEAIAPADVAENKMVVDSDEQGGAKGDDGASSALNKGADESAPASAEGDDGDHDVDDGAEDNEKHKRRQRRSERSHSPSRERGERNERRRSRSRERERKDEDRRDDRRERKDDDRRDDRSRRNNHHRDTSSSTAANSSSARRSGGRDDESSRRGERSTRDHDRDRGRERDHDRDRYSRRTRDEDRHARHRSDDTHRSKATESSESDEEEEEEQIDEDTRIERQRKRRLQLLAKLKSAKESTAATIAPTATEMAKKASAAGSVVASLSGAAGQNASSTSSPEPLRTLAGTEKKPLVSKAKKIEIDDDDDMFSEKFDPTAATAGGAGNSAQVQVNDVCDDGEGYYIMRTGEKLDNRYEVYGFTGAGVFSNVVRAYDLQQSRSQVAIKIIRNNDVMYKAAKKELEILRLINSSDANGRWHCIRLIDNFEHRGHLCMVFEHMSMNLREVIKKYGKNEGLNLRAVHTYATHLIMSLKLIRKCRVLHADIKPDNILVNDAKTLVKLCDFGSASTVEDNAIAPYLVSRFYRAPEIMLGLDYSYGIDMWAMACTLFELYTGDILFKGRSNNDMLKEIIDIRGKIPSKMIRRGQFRINHFDEDNNLLHTEIDKITKKPSLKIVKPPQAPMDLMQLIVQSSGHNEMEKKKLKQFRDLLDRMLMIDPEKRISPKDALQHPFIKEPFEN